MPTTQENRDEDDETYIPIMNVHPNDAGGRYVWRARVVVKVQRTRAARSSAVLPASRPPTGLYAAARCTTAQISHRRAHTTRRQRLHAHPAWRGDKPHPITREPSVCQVSCVRTSGGGASAALRHCSGGARRLMSVIWGG